MESRERRGAADILRTRKQPEEQRAIPSSESSLCKGPVAHRRELRSGETRRGPGVPVWCASHEVWCQGDRRAGSRGTGRKLPVILNETDCHTLLSHSILQMSAEGTGPWIFKIDIIF